MQNILELIDFCRSVCANLAERKRALRQIPPDHDQGLCYTSGAPRWALFKVLMHICCSWSVCPPPRLSSQMVPFVKPWPLTWAAPARCPPARRTNTPAAAPQKETDAELFLSPAETFSRKKTCPHLGVGVVGVPRGSQGLLASNVPHQEMSVLHHNFFHIASNGGWCMDNLVHQTLDIDITNEYLK